MEVPNNRLALSMVLAALACLAAGAWIGATAMAGRLDQPLSLRGQLVLLLPVVAFALMFLFYRLEAP